MSGPTKISCTITDDKVSVLINYKYRVLDRASEKGQQLLDALREVPQDPEKIAAIADVNLWIASKSFGRVVIDDRDQLRLDGRLVNYGIAGKLQDAIKDGLDVSPLVHFLENVDENPDKSVAEDLYAFISRGQLPITPDGRFHSWKYVAHDYRSVASGNEDCEITFPPSEEHPEGHVEIVRGRIPHPVGGSVRMKREDCNPNRHQTCSVGLHACSINYLDQYVASNRVVLVLINPKDVTAIPVDYNQAKLRCCYYEVVAEVPMSEVKDHLKKGVETRYVEPRPEQRREPDGPVIPPIERYIAQEPEVIRDEAYWREQGCEQGKSTGREDRVHDSFYDPSPSVPNDIIADAAKRAAYVSAYVECYEEAYAGAVTGEDEDDATTSLATAAALGAEDGEENGSNAYDQNDDFEIEPASGDQHDQLHGAAEDDDAPDEVLEVYDRHYARAYAEAWTPDEFASEKVVALAKADAEAKAVSDTLEGGFSFDASPSRGKNWHRFNSGSEHEITYNRTYVLAYCDKFDEVKPMTLGDSASEALDNRHVDQGGGDGGSSNLQGGSGCLEGGDGGSASLDDRHQSQGDGGSVGFEPGASGGLAQDGLVGGVHRDDEAGGQGGSDVEGNRD